MNILLLCGSLSYAGAQRQLLELAKGLNLNHSVIVCSITSKVVLLQEFNDNEITVKVLKLRKRNVIKVILALRKIINSEDIAVVYSFLETANTYARIIKFFEPHIKVISSERSSDLKASFFTKIVERIFSRVTDLYIANSYAGKKALFKNYKVKNVKVIYNGVNRERFFSLGELKININLDHKIIVTQIGRIKPDKNYEMFLKVADSVCDLNKSVLFLAIGDEPNSENTYKDSISKLRDKLKNKDRILFLGARSDIPEILSKTDISTLTSHREGCSNTVLESMFAKCPLVVTDVGDNKKMLSQNNQDFIVKPGNIQEMTEKILHLINNPDLRKEIGQDNFIKAEKEFTQEVMVKNTEKVILELLSNNMNLG